jgi:hypothetical protein
MDVVVNKRRKVIIGRRRAKKRLSMLSLPALRRHRGLRVDVGDSIEFNPPGLSSTQGVKSG